MEREEKRGKGREKERPRRAESSPQYERRGRASGRCQCTYRHTGNSLPFPPPPPPLPLSDSNNSLSSISLSPLSAGAEVLNSFTASEEDGCAFTHALLWRLLSPSLLLLGFLLLRVTVKLEFQGFAQVNISIRQSNLSDCL